MSELQSPFVGVKERNLAQTFEVSLRDDAILQIDEVDSFLRDRRSTRQSREVTQVNEFLTQLERFDGIFIASTNLMDGIDSAAMRRFDYKVRIDYLRKEQARSLLVHHLGLWGIGLDEDKAVFNELDAIDRLAPGDFAMLSRRRQLTPIYSARDVVTALREEVRFKGESAIRIGFT